MTREEAMEILINDGWNEEGATAILDRLDESDITLDWMTEGNLLSISLDYKDR